MAATSIETRLARLEEAEQRRELEHRARVLSDVLGTEYAAALETVERVNEAYRSCVRLSDDPRAVSLCMAQHLGEDDEKAEEMLALAGRIAEDAAAGLTYEQIVRREAARPGREVGRGYAG
jgi:hypothetical protein